MSTKKYNKELKLAMCEKYKNGISLSEIIKECNLPTSMARTIKEWYRKYEEYGEDVFNNEIKKKTNYSKEFKAKIIEEYLYKGLSSYDLSIKYNISSSSVVRGWIRKYNDGVELMEFNPKKGVYTMKSRKTTLEERIEIVNYVLANDNDYKGAAEKYNVTYANVYQWVMKYNRSGVAGISDNRGRPSSPKTTKELSEVEKKEIEIEKLKEKLEYLELENRVLKKNIEIQEQMERDSRLYGKKTNTKR